MTSKARETPILQPVTGAGTRHHSLMQLPSYILFPVPSPCHLHAHWLLILSTLMVSCPQLHVALSALQNLHLFFPPSHKSASVLQYAFFILARSFSFLLSLHTPLMRSTEKQQGIKRRAHAMESGVRSKSGFTS